MSVLNSRISIVMVTLLLVIILVACVACSGTTQNNSGDNIWKGKWDTEQWGEMTLQQNGSNVTGGYEWDGGKITGMVSGNMLKGTWSESPTYQLETDAGDFEFTISSDGNSFTAGGAMVPAGIGMVTGMANVSGEDSILELNY